MRVSQLADAQQLKVNVNVTRSTQYGWDSPTEFVSNNTKLPELVRDASDVSPYVVVLLPDIELPFLAWLRKTGHRNSKKISELQSLQWFG
jgi:hypothetical protein